MALPREQRRLDRYLHVAERVAMQGFNPASVAMLSVAQAIRAAGNAYSPQVVFKVLQPFMLLCRASFVRDQLPLPNITTVAGDILEPCNIGPRAIKKRLAATTRRSTGKRRRH